MVGNIANQPRSIFIQTPMPLGHASSVVDEVAVFILSLDLSMSQVGLTSLNPPVFPALDIDDRASMDCLPVSSTKVKVLLQGYAATPLRLARPLCRVQRRQQMDEIYQLNCSGGRKYQDLSKLEGFLLMPKLR